MEVKELNSALLSNFEVYKLLTEVKTESNNERHIIRAPKGLSTIVYESIKYLENTPGAIQSPEIIKEFCRAVAPFRLTKAEKLQILNLRPTTPVEIQLIIEECEERLSEEKVNELTEIISRILPSKSENIAGTSTVTASNEEDQEFDN